MKKNVIITFGDILLESTDGSMPPKNLTNFECEFDPQATIYMGSYYSTKWKHVEKLEISDDSTLRLHLVDTKNQRKVVFSNPTDSKAWERLQKLVHKKSRKMASENDNNNMDSEQKPRQNTKKNLRAGRSTYGSRNRRVSQKEVLYNDPMWHNEEDDDDVVNLNKKNNNNPKVDDDSAMDSSPPEIVAEEDDDDSDDDGDLLSSKKTPKPTTRKRLRKKIMEDSDEDTDDDEFPAVEMTTPAVQRAVSPEMEDNREEMMEEEKENEEDQEEEDEESPPTTKTAKISKYFLPRTNNVTSKKSHPTGGSKDKKKAPTVATTTTNTTTNKITTSRTGSSATKTYSATPKATYSTTPTDFFSSPFRQNKIESPPPGTPTKTPPAPTSYVMINTTKRKIGSSKMDEDDRDEEDEIEEIDGDEGNSSSSPQRRSHLVTASVKRRRTYGEGGLSWRSSALNDSGGFSSSGRKQNLRLFRESTENPSSPYRGFRNRGNDCYMNASLQMLITSEPFIKALEGKGGELVKSVVDRAHDVQNISSLPANARPVKKEMDKLSDKFHGDSQQDSHEFLADLIDHIHEELTETEKASSDYETLPNPKFDVVDGSRNIDPSREVSDQDDDDGAAAATNNGETYSVRGDTTTSNSEPGALIKIAPASSISPAPEANQETTTKEKAKETLPTDKYFRCDVEMCLTCTSCGYSRTRMEVFRHLSLGVEAPPEEGKISIQNSFERFFKPEVLELKCEKCPDGKTASQVMKLVNRPRAILLHLKRFVVVQPEPGKENANNHGYEVVFRKNKAPVEISKQLSLKKVAAGKHGDDQSKEDASGQYSLVSIVTHVGSRASSGHYTAEAMRRRRLPTSDNNKGGEEEEVLHNNSETEWVKFDDSKTEVTSLEEIVSNQTCQKNAYMLLYALDS